MRLLLRLPWHMIMENAAVTKQPEGAHKRNTMS